MKILYMYIVNIFNLFEEPFHFFTLSPKNNSGHVAA